MNKFERTMMEGFFKFLGVFVGLFFWWQALLFLGGSSSIPMVKYYFFSSQKENVFPFEMHTSYILGSALLYFFGLLIASAIDKLGKVLSVGHIQVIHDYKEKGGKDTPQEHKKSFVNGLSAVEWMMIMPFAASILSWLFFGLRFLIQK